MKRGIMFLLTAALFIPAIQSMAQVSADEAMQKLKDRENAQAIKRLADLEKEVALLRKEIDSLKTDIGPTTAPVARPTPTTLPVNVSTGPHSLADLLAKLPKDARPIPKSGWGKFALADANQWFDENVKGKEVVLEGVFAEAVDVGHVSGRDRGSGDANAWGVTTRITLMGQEISGVQHRLFVNGVDPCSFTCDEATARQWQAIKSGQHVRVQGVISHMEVLPDRYSINGKGSALSMSIAGVKIVPETPPSKP